MTNRQLLTFFPLGLLVACSSTTASRADEATASGELRNQGSSLFQGAGTSGAGEPLGAEIPPSTAHDCVPVGISTAVPGAGPAQLTCYYDASVDPTSPSATIERRLEIVDDRRWIHLRLTFDPSFVDNSYGENAIGWGDAEEAMAVAPPPGGEPQKQAKPKKAKGGHTFKDLVGSDHAEFQLFDKGGDLKMQFKVDYISESSDVSVGYACLGVTGGEGKMIVGDPEWVLGATSSLDRNLNGCGLTDYLVDSPATDSSYTPNPEAPAWDYRVVYEVWVAEEPFGVDGFGDALIEYVHASPSKADGDTLIVVPGPCPPPPDVPPPGSTPPPDDTVPPPSTTDIPTSEPDAGADEPVNIPRPAR